MKGFVFTEFLEMVEEAHGYELVDKLLVESHLPSGGNYTSVGTYDHAEMITLVNNLSAHLGVPAQQLLRTYGRYMFNSFTRNYGLFISRSSSAFDLLSSIQQYIHMEVRKLYPEAELPHFTITQPTPERLVMHYESERKLADFARGLIEGCLAHFGEAADITESRLAADGSNVIFEVTKNGNA